MSEQHGTINVIVLHFGYAEEARLASIVAIADCCFNTEKEAIKSLAEELFLKFKTNVWTKKYDKECCKKSSNIEGGNFCYKCGLYLEKKEDLIYEYFMSWLLDLLTYTNDDFGYAEEIDGVLLHWEIGFSPMHLIGRSSIEVVCIVENAEKVLAKAVGWKE
jgi:hypothetical protein